MFADGMLIRHTVKQSEAFELKVWKLQEKKAENMKWKFSGSNSKEDVIKIEGKKKNSYKTVPILIFGSN